MSNDTTVRVTADATGYSAALDSANKSAQAFMAQQDAASKRVQVAQQAIAEAATNGSKASASAINAFVTQLTRAADSAGKTRSQLLELKAAQLGISDATAGSIAQLKAAEAATSENGAAIEHMGAQSAGARRELLVMVHEASQGNWTKLAGSVQVFGERIDLMGKLLSPTGVALGVVAGAVVGFGVEVVKGIVSLSALGNASNVTNGYLGLTNDEFVQMSVGIAGTSQSITSVQDAMTALVSSGKVAADQLALATKVTAEFASDTHTSVDTAAEALIKFAEDPQKALEDLQSQYHTFSAAQVDVIENYIRTGDSASAYMAILAGMDEAHERFKDGAQKNIGLVQQFWQALKSEVTWEINQINQLGVAASNADQLTAALQQQAKAQRDLAQAKSMPFGNTMSAQAELNAADAQVTAIQKTMAAQAQAASDSKSRAAGGDAEVSVNKYLNNTQYASPLEQRTLAIKKENAAYAAATKDVDQTSAAFVAAEQRHAENLAQIDKEYANRDGSKQIENASVSAHVKSAQDALTAIDDANKNSMAVLKEQHDAGLSDDGDYYGAIQDLIDKTTTAKLAQLDVEEGYLKQQTTSGAAQIKLNQQIAAVEVQKAKVVADAAAAQQSTDAAQDKASAGRLADLKKYQAALDQALATQQEAIDNQVASVGAGSQAFSRQQNITKITEKFNKTDTDLVGALPANANDDMREQLAQKLAANDAARDATVAAWQEGYARMDAAQSNWVNGATKGFANFQVSANDIAGQTASTFTAAFDGLANTLANFVTTGKLNFQSLATSIIGDIAKMEIKAAESSLFGYIAGLSGVNVGNLSGVSGALGTTGSGAPMGFGGGVVATVASSDVFAATGGYISGPGSSTSDSIHARLSNGEYVLNAEAVKRLGKSNLDNLNNGANIHRFATGGMVGSGGAVPPVASSGTQVHLAVSAGGAPGGSSFSPSDAKWLQSSVQRLVDLRMKQKMSGQGGFAYQLRNGQVA